MAKTRSMSLSSTNPSCAGKSPGSMSLPFCAVKPIDVFGLKDRLVRLLDKCFSALILTV